MGQKSDRPGSTRPKIKTAHDQRVAIYIYIWISLRLRRELPQLKQTKKSESISLLKDSLPKELSSLFDLCFQITKMMQRRPRSKPTHGVINAPVPTT
jgi:hypothetical protein